MLGTELTKPTEKRQVREHRIVRSYLALPLYRRHLIIKITRPLKRFLDHSDHNLERQ